MLYFPAKIEIIILKKVFAQRVAKQGLLEVMLENVFILFFGSIFA